MLTILEEEIGHEEGLGHWYRSPDSAGGVSIKLSFRNDFNKTIKYIYFQVVPFNSVGDVVKSDIIGQNGILQYTGSLAPGKTAWDRRWDNCFYNWSIKGVQVVSATIEFMDGTKQIIKEFNYGRNRSFNWNDTKTIFGKSITIKRLVLACIALGVAIFTLISLKFGISVSSENEWLIVLTRIFYYCQLIVALGFIVVEAIGLFHFKENVVKKLELALIITCCALNVIHAVLGIIAACLVRFINYAFMAIIFNLPFTIAYFICRKK